MCRNYMNNVLHATGSVNRRIAAFHRTWPQIGRQMKPIVS